MSPHQKQTQSKFFPSGIGNWHVYPALIPWLNPCCCATFSPPPFQAWPPGPTFTCRVLCSPANWQANPSTVSLSPQQPVVCLLGLPLRNIYSAILHILPSYPHLSLCITCSTLHRLAGPQLRPILEFCLRGRALRRGRVKRGRVHCIASTQPATPRIAKREGGAASVQCKMQSSIAESS